MQFLRAWRFRVLAARALRVALFLDIAGRLMRLRPEKFLPVLRREKKAEELRKPDEEIRLMEERIARRRGREPLPDGP